MSANFFPQDEVVLFAPLLLSLMAECLACCFCGYVLYRVILALGAAEVGAAGAAMLLRYLRPEATGVEQLLACAVGAAGLGLVGWFLYRITFALSVAAVTAGVHIVLCLVWGRPVVVGVVFGALIGLGVGALAFLFTRVIWIIASAFLGALGAVACAAAILLRAGEMIAGVVSPEMPPRPVFAVAAVLAVAVAAAGAYVQFRYTSRIRLALAPPAEPEAPKAKASASGAKRHAKPAMA